MTLLFLRNRFSNQLTSAFTRLAPTGIRLFCQMGDNTPKELQREESKKSLLNVEYIASVNRAGDLKAGLIDTFLHLEKIDKNIFLARHLLQPRRSYPAVYGGQVIGQALAAATATIDNHEMIPHSLHSFFLLTGNVQQPILYSVDRIRDGRSFANRLVKAVQNGENIFTTQISYHKPEDSAIKHSEKMPDVPGPENLEDTSVILEKAKEDENLPKHVRATAKRILDEIAPAFHRTFSFRPLNKNALLHNDPNVDNHSMLWIKTNENIGDDKRLHYTTAAYISDAFMIETAIRPHASKGFIPGMALTLDHCLWIHDTQFRVDEWLLFETTSPIAKDGRAFITGRMWTRDGRLVMSCTQEGLVRASRPKPTPPESSAEKKAE